MAIHTNKHLITDVEDVHVNIKQNKMTVDLVVTLEGYGVISRRSVTLTQEDFVNVSYAMNFTRLAVILDKLLIDRGFIDAGTSTTEDDSIKQAEDYIAKVVEEKVQEILKAQTDGVSQPVSTGIDVVVKG